MKKLMFILSIFFTSILITSAAPCKVISGDGTNIGDEIQCGTENFYVLSNDGENVKMLAKYNLYVGSSYHKVIFDETFETWRELYKYYEDNYRDEYPEWARALTNDKGLYNGMILFKSLEYDEIKQSEEAIGAHGDLKVDPIFPEIGVYNYFASSGDGFSKYVYNSKIEYQFYKGGYADIDLNFEDENDSLMVSYLLGYRDYLEENKIDVNSINILSVNEINEIVKNITNKDLPLEEWSSNQENWGYVDPENYLSFYIVGSIKDLMPDGYDWLWSTTYWTRTVMAYSSNDYKLFFIDTMGDLCTDNFCSASVGAGIRPVVTIPATLIYNIETKTDGNGTVEADHVEAEGGTEIKFTVTPNE